MFKFDNAALERYERQLTNLYERALPVANRFFLNDAAFAIARQSKQNVREGMTLRNQWTERSIRVERAKGNVIKHQRSEVGSIEEYMHDQEFGAVETKKGKHGVAIPTGWSAGQEGQKPRTRLVRKANKMRSIKLTKGSGGSVSRSRRRNAALVGEAVESKKRFVYMDLGRRKGIFKVIGGRKSKKDGKVRGARVKMVHDLSHKVIRTPANPWLSPATDTVQPRFPRMYGRRLLEQIKRQRTFRR